MIKSMTAFANHQLANDSGLIQWELRAVNQRFLELNFRLPDLYRDLEAPLRNMIKNIVQRGRVDITLRYSANENNAQKIIVNQDILTDLYTALEKIKMSCAVTVTADAMQILSWPGVVKSETTDTAEIKQAILASFQHALNDLEQTRLREGKQLKEFIMLRLEKMDKELEKIKQGLPEIFAQQKIKLTERLKELQVECAIERVEQEIALLIQKADITEELDRLETHIKETQRVLSTSQSGAAGRRLDFLAQEMHREANTLGSKSIHTLTSQASLELKLLIEQIREQVQNIE